MYDGMLFRHLIISLLDIIRNLLNIRDGISFRHTHSNNKCNLLI